MRILARFVATLAAASVLIFLLMRAVPGNPARVALGVNATTEKVDQLSATLGLDKPLWTQYWEWVSGLLTGNLGTSLTSQTDITAQVIDRAQVSLILALSAMVVALACAIPVGVWLARRNGHPTATVITALAQAGIAIPSFLLGILLVTVFAIHYQLLPANGWIPPNQGFAAFSRHLVLPVMALASVQGAILTRYVRSAVLETADQDYIRTARSLGASRSQAINRHGLRNAALPVLTVAGLQLTSMAAGAVVIEKVFVIPGIGTMLLDAVSNRDLTTVQTLIMLFVAFTLCVNLVVDVAYRSIDPRLKEARS
ncbi:ABC transporter permease [Corynebacterium phocae]|uniref:ABC transporter permease n=1 Tax=Corynebacterium phocae TaxID=161895 RepID=A0A1L7D1U1_9CORY|nr:ABC transporter permease [Corynebacterium phocae]APT92099.1 ABC transporter permease [Corynebacterium phocae]KAA8726483.1 ABC transporter permease [Corynebacterium phocae]